MPTLLITGANRGIGLALLRGFAADGWRIHACCRQPDKAGDLKAVAGEIRLHRVDVTDGLRVASLARELADEAIDLLINNAGIYGPRTGFGETDYDDWLKVLAVNTLAPLRLVERFVEHVGRSDRKLVVNVSSRMGSISQNAGGAYIYRSSKAALNAVTKGLSADLAARGITVVAVHPGWVQTDMGGAGADISADTSAAGLRRVIEGLSAEDSGRFFNHDGEEIPW
ncbi:MAG: SDR family oxidoreductase [Kiloniellales bacterium]|nr:SDR family oxidoreductase [Kiloniellales bacterium]